jgi:hypothetical protein
MNEVKDVCARLLAEPEPPMRDAAEVLATARRSARRGRLAVAGSGLAVLVAVAVGAAAFLPGGAVGQKGAAPAPAPDEEATAVAPPAPVPIPPAQASAAHRRQMDRVLRRAVPPGYAARSDTAFSRDRTVHPRTLDEDPGHGTVLAAYGRVVVERDGRQGVLFAVIAADFAPMPTVDLCHPSLARAMNESRGTSCQVIYQRGIPIRVSTARDAERGEVVVAVRYLRGGYLMVSSAQGRPVHEPETDLPPDAAGDGRRDGKDRLPPLPAPALTAAQVAAIAADPAMLP